MGILCSIIKKDGFCANTFRRRSFEGAKYSSNKHCERWLIMGTDYSWQLIIVQLGQQRLTTPMFNYCGAKHNLHSEVCDAGKRMKCINWRTLIYYVNRRRDTYKVIKY